jgi:hypothetical protein
MAANSVSPPVPQEQVCHLRPSVRDGMVELECGDTQLRFRSLVFAMWHAVGSFPGARILIHDHSGDVVREIRPGERLGAESQSLS